ncbi:MAG: tRNA (adenosine(37)-N6)-dimethylallyltransferase MiaA [Rickettsiales bacterium]|nr:tRNA (adenosine(37)-N6)-dimethylallyltransferase MiaA [Rickettsiales bacterium]
MFSKLLVISGPTASGKSRFADAVYSKIPSVIINADALQVYDALPILTAKPKEFRDHSKYVLYDALSVDKECSVVQWVSMAEQEITKAWSRGILPIIVGGTGFYIRALLYGVSAVPSIQDDVIYRVEQRYKDMGKEEFFNLLCKTDPGAKKLHLNDKYRLLRAAAVFEQTGKSVYSYSESNVLKYNDCSHIFFDPNRANLYQWCNDRFKNMLDEGVLDEVRTFIACKNGACAIEKAIGYKQIVMYLNGDISLDQVTQDVQRLTRNYAKRQYTWFYNQIKHRISVQYDNYCDVETKVLDDVMRFAVT